MSGTLSFIFTDQACWWYPNQHLLHQVSSIRNCFIHNLLSTICALLLNSLWQAVSGTRYSARNDFRSGGHCVFHTQLNNSDCARGSLSFSIRLDFLKIVLVTVCLSIMQPGSNFHRQTGNHGAARSNRKYREMNCTHWLASSFILMAAPLCRSRCNTSNLRLHLL